MWLERLTVKGFRNLQDLAAQFDSRSNYLFGANAAGKTSLLEAIHFLAIGRSFRPAQDQDVMKFGAELFSIQGQARAADDVLRHAEIRGDGRLKKLFQDGIEVQRLSSYLGWLPVVTILLDDIRLVRGGPGERRAFLDLALSKVSKPYLQALAEYRRVLVQRNRILTQTNDETLLRTWENQLAATGTAVYQLRNRYVPELLASASEIASGLLPTKAFGFSYRTTISQEGDIQTDFIAALAQHRPRERALGFTLVGPHRDDILMSQADRELRRFGSEGEHRSASIALKLAEAKLLRAQCQEAPVFLLDEIASELDAERSSKLFALLETQGQIFYAAAKPIPSSGRVFHVQAGQIQAA